jgi:branched-chain amino acid transport system permease protein
MGLFYDLVTSGILVGSIYAMASVGLTMIFGVLRAINFAHGEYYMLGAFSSWAGMTLLGASYPWSLVLTVLGGAILGVLISWLIMERLIDAPFQRAVLVTLGVYLIIQNLVLFLFGGSYKTFPGGWFDLVEIAGVSGIAQRFVVLGTMIVVFASLETFIRFSRTGKAIRAVAQNRKAAVIMGIDVRRITRITFTIGIVLAMLAGALTAPILVTIYPSMGEGMTFKAFAVTVIAGLGNVHGVILSSIILGISESLVAGYLGTQFREAVGFVALIAVLMWRPYGLFARPTRF